MSDEIRAMTPEQAWLRGVNDAMECAKQIVRAYGPPLPEHTREGLIGFMELYRASAKLER